MKYLKITLLDLLFFWRYLRKKALKKKKRKKNSEKKSSENDQSTGHFQSFLFIFFRPPTLGLKKNCRKSTNKKNLA